MEEASQKRWHERRGGQRDSPETENRMDCDRQVNDLSEGGLDGAKVDLSGPEGEFASHRGKRLGDS